MSRYELEDDEPYIVIEKHSGSFGSLLAGMAIGAGLALLFAPASGEETRREITTRARRAQRRAKKAVRDAGDAVVDSFEEARAQVEERIDAARAAIDTKREQVSRAMSAGREAAAQARLDLERRIAETKAAYNAGADVARSTRPVRGPRTAGSRPARPRTAPMAGSQGSLGADDDIAAGI